MCGDFKLNIFLIESLVIIFIFFGILGIVDFCNVFICNIKVFYVSFLILLNVYKLFWVFMFNLGVMCEFMLI